MDNEKGVERTRAKRDMVRKMKQAVSEIRMLRRDNKIMGEKLALVEGLLHLKNMNPYGGDSPQTEDVTYLLDEYANQIEHECEQEDEKFNKVGKA